MTIYFTNKTQNRDLGLKLDSLKDWKNTVEIVIDRMDAESGRV